MPENEYYNDEETNKVVESELTELESFEGPDTESVTTIETGELTAICPFEYGNGRDFYDLTVHYRPDELCLETKSFRDFIRDLDNEKISVEDLGDLLYRRIEDAIEPDSLYVRLEQGRRGGLEHTEVVGDTWLDDMV